MNKSEAELDRMIAAGLSGRGIASVTGGQLDADKPDAPKDVREMSELEFRDYLRRRGIA